MGRLPIPAGLKRHLVPYWNEAHRIGWLVRDYSAACARVDGRPVPFAGSSGRCCFAGELSPANSRNCGVSLPGWPGALARKESSDCANCGAKLGRDGLPR